MSSTLSIFSEPCFGDENPFASSVTEAAPAPSPFDLSTSNASSVQLTMETLETHINLNDEPHDLLSPVHPAAHQDLTETAPICSFKPPALSTSEDHPSIDSAQDHTVHASSPASNDSNSLSPSCVLDLEEKSYSKNDAMKEFNLVSPLPSSLRLSEIEHEHLPKANITNRAEESAVTNESQLSQQLLLSNLPSPAHLALKLSLFSSSASNSTTTNLPVTEGKAESSEPQHDNSCDYPVMEPSSLFGTNQLTNRFTFTAPTDSQCLPPPAPRPALAMLPGSESELDLSAGPLTSMNHLLSSLSQNQNSDSASAPTNGDEPLYSDGSSDQFSAELVLTSSSPGGNNLPSSSPPNSSPPFTFSSSPLETHSRIMVTGTNEARLRPERSAHHIEIYPSSPVIPWISQTPKNQSRLSPIAVASSPFQEKLSQESQILLEEHMRSFPSSDDPLHIISSSDEDSSLSNPVEAGSVAFPVSLSTPSSPSPSSPPAREVRMNAVPSSPVSSPGMNLSAVAFSSPPKKRKRDCEDEGSRSLPGSPTKPGKPQMYVLPAPKRATVASQRRQHRKLITPFKSPLMIKTAKIENEEKEPRMNQCIAPVNDYIPNAPIPPAPLAKSFVVESKKKHFTTRAAAQFKSPLSSTGNANLSQNIRLTPSIQVLERKIQILKRAVKVKKDNEEKVLADLATQWTDAGREVAWEVWELVKGGDNSSGGCASAEKRSFQESWGWNGQGDEKRTKLEVGEESWGWNTTAQAQSTDEGAIQQEDEELRVKGQQMDEDEERVEYTLGTMLRRLGIDPATLGWDDEEGIFKDS